MSNPDLLETIIERRSQDVLRLYEMANNALVGMRMWFTDEARRAAADVADLTALRSPETVARLEREKGLL